MEFENISQKGWENSFEAGFCLCLFFLRVVGLVEVEVVQQKNM